MKTKTIKLLADSYTIDWCERVTAEIRVKFSFSDNVINSLLNLALDPQVYHKKAMRLAHAILSAQEEVVSLTDTETQLIINIIFKS